jgi:plastocyanin
MRSVRWPVLVLTVALAVTGGDWPALAARGESPVLEPCERSCSTQVLTAFAMEYVPKRQKTIGWGDTLEFFNADPAALAAGGHTVTHFNPFGPPRFDSGVVPVGVRAKVLGAEYLLPGKYLIFCRIHPSMRGKIQVIGGSLDVVPIAP